MKIKTLDEFFSELNDVDLSIAVDNVLEAESTGIYDESSFIRIILDLANKQFPTLGQLTINHLDINDAEKSCFREAAKRFSKIN